MADEAVVTPRTRPGSSPVYDVRLPDGREVRSLTLVEVARLGRWEPSVARLLDGSGKADQEEQG